MNTTTGLSRRSLITGVAATAGAAVLVSGANAPAAQAATETRGWGPAWAPFTNIDPVEGRSDRKLTPKRVTVRFANSTEADLFGPNKGSRGVYPHFYNPLEGALRQHQALNRQAAFDRAGNSTTISITHAGTAGSKLNEGQLDKVASLFAWSVATLGVANRIATIDDLDGLAWHRLGMTGDFGTYDPNVRQTWSREQTGADWSTYCTRVCPRNNVIGQIDDIYQRAQDFLKYARGAS